MLSKLFRTALHIILSCHLKQLPNFGSIFLLNTPPCPYDSVQGAILWSYLDLCPNSRLGMDLLGSFDFVYLPQDCC